MEKDLRMHLKLLGEKYKEYERYKIKCQLFREDPTGTVDHWGGQGPSQLITDFRKSFYAQILCTHRLIFS